MRIYVAKEIAGLLRVNYKSVLNLINSGQLEALPGLRHKRVTEAALQHYLGVPGASAHPAIPNGPGQAVGPMNGQSTRPSAGHGASKGQIVGRSNGEGRGVACHVSKPNGKK